MTSRAADVETIERLLSDHGMREVFDTMLVERFAQMLDEAIPQLDVVTRERDEANTRSEKLLQDMGVLSMHLKAEARTAKLDKDVVQARLDAVEYELSQACTKAYQQELAFDAFTNRCWQPEVNAKCKVLKNSSTQTTNVPMDTIFESDANGGDADAENVFDAEFPEMTPEPDVSTAGLPSYPSSGTPESQSRDDWAKVTRLEAAVSPMRQVMKAQQAQLAGYLSPATPQDHVAVDNQRQVLQAQLEAQRDLLQRQEHENHMMTRAIDMVKQQDFKNVPRDQAIQAQLATDLSPTSPQPQDSLHNGRSPRMPASSYWAALTARKFIARASISGSRSSPELPRFPGAAQQPSWASGVQARAEDSSGSHRAAAAPGPTLFHSVSGPQLPTAMVPSYSSLSLQPAPARALTPALRSPSSSAATPASPAAVKRAPSSELSSSFTRPASRSPMRATTPPAQSQGTLPPRTPPVPFTTPCAHFGFQPRDMQKTGPAPSPGGLPGRYSSPDGSRALSPGSLERAGRSPSSRAGIPRQHSFQCGSKAASVNFTVGRPTSASNMVGPPRSPQPKPPWQGPTVLR